MSAYLDHEEEYAMHRNRLKTEHLQAVERFHVGMGVDVPIQPTVPSNARLIARAKLLMEETLEFIEAAGIELQIQSSMMLNPAPLRFEHLQFVKIKPADMIEMADGLADVAVITAGGMAICGIADLPLLREVDDNNLLKLSTGHFDDKSGKFIKAKNHPKPDITAVLKAQGWTDENVHVSCSGQ